MKTIATIAASLVLSVGVMTGPAFAETQTPGHPHETPIPCDRMLYTYKSMYEMTDARLSMADAMVYKLGEEKIALEQQVAEAAEENERLQSRIDRKDDRIARLQKKLAQARR